MPILTTTEIERAFAWGAPKEIHTKRGPRILRKANATAAAREFWRTHKSDLAAAGVMFSEYPHGSGRWSFSWFQEIPSSVQAERAATREASRATDADVEIPRPPGLEYMGFQRAGIAFMRQKPGVLLADEMGLGKTIQVIGRMNDHPEAERVLITCPASLTLNWIRELRKWLVRPTDIGLVDGKTFPTSKVIVVSHSMLHKWRERIWAVHWDMVAIDEAHKMKSPTAQRTKVLMGYKPKKDEPAEMAQAPVMARFRVAVTGTPICNKPAELWPLIHWVRPDVWPQSDWWRFHTRYAGFAHNGFGYAMGDGANLEELQKKLRETTMVRRLKKDVLTELPPKVRTLVSLPCPPEVLRAEREQLGGDIWEEEETECAAAAVELAKASDDPEAYIAAVKRMNARVKIGFDQVSSIRRMTALAKVPMTIEFVQEEMEDGGIQKAILFAHHIEVMDKLMEGLAEFHPLRIDGGVSVVDRQAAVDKFQNDPKHRLIIVGIQAGGVGLTLTAASAVYFHELDWVPGNVTQAEDRAHRIGQTDTVMVKQLVFDGTIDAKMASTIIRKQDIADRALDRREVEKLPMVERQMQSIELTEPVRPVVEHVTCRRQELREAGAKLNDAQVAAIHRALQQLAGVCDYAHARDGAGFNGTDARIGHSLAQQESLSRTQAALGLKIVRKYRRQIGDIAAEVAALTEL